MVRIFFAEAAEFHLDWPTSMHLYSHLRKKSHETHHPRFGEPDAPALGPADLLCIAQHVSQTRVVAAVGAKGLEIPVFPELDGLQPASAFRFEPIVLEQLVELRACVESHGVLHHVERIHRLGRPVTHITATVLREPREVELHAVEGVDVLGLIKHLDHWRWILAVEAVRLLIGAPHARYGDEVVDSDAGGLDVESDGRSRRA